MQIYFDIPANADRGLVESAIQESLVSEFLQDRACQDAEATVAEVGMSNATDASECPLQIRSNIHTTPEMAVAFVGSVWRAQKSRTPME